MVARTALRVRRLDAAGCGSTRAAVRARRRLDRAHVAALRVAPPAPTLVDVLAAVGQGDHLPAATSVPAPGSRALGVLDVACTAAAEQRPATVTEQVAWHDVPLFDPALATADEDEPDTLALAVDVVRAHPHITGARLAERLTARGRPVSTRSGQRWRTRALAALTADTSVR